MHDCFYATSWQPWEPFGTHGNEARPRSILAHFTRRRSQGRLSVTILARDVI